LSVNPAADESIEREMANVFVAPVRFDLHSGCMHLAVSTVLYLLMHLAVSTVQE
jgi:hypothetical protein